MPKWIHDRAMSMKDDMEKTYGPEKAKQVAFAVATQQAHRLGKSPKTFKSKATGKKERFGTTEGRRKAMSKFNRPKSDYEKTASVIMLNAFTDELEKIAGLAIRPVPIPKKVPTLGERASGIADKLKGAWQKGRKEGFVFLKPEHRASNPVFDKAVGLR